MSLSAAERKRTGEELQANYRKAGLTPEKVQADLRLSAAQLAETLDVTSASRPENVWLLRDYLEEEVKGRGEQPCPYTYLTDEMRGVAARWFPLRKPEHTTPHS